LNQVRTLCPEENDTALVCFPAVEDLRGVQQIENGTGDFEQTISCIFIMANCSDHWRWVTCLALTSPFGPIGSSRVRVLPIVEDTSTRKMVAVDLQL
jgi:hypothetical protein